MAAYTSPIQHCTISSRYAIEQEKEMKVIHIEKEEINYLFFIVTWLSIRKSQEINNKKQTSKKKKQNPKHFLELMVNYSKASKLHINTRLIHKSQLLSYIRAMNNWKWKKHNTAYISTKNKKNREK